MATKNDITGDKLISKPSTKEYEDNYNKIFRKDKLAQSEVSTNQSVVLPTESEEWEGGGGV